MRILVGLLLCTNNTHDVQQFHVAFILYPQPLQWKLWRWQLFRLKSKNFHYPFQQQRQTIIESQSTFLHLFSKYVFPFVFPPLSRNSTDPTPATYGHRSIRKMLANLRVRGFVLIEIDKKSGMILMFIVHYPFLLFRILPKFLMKMSHETFRSRDVKIMSFLFYSMCNLLDIGLNSELYFVSFAFS